MTVLKDGGGLELALAVIENERPYWLFHALLVEAAKAECIRDPENPCAQTSDCITEWCCNCAARAWLAEEENGHQQGDRHDGAGVRGEPGDRKQ